MSVVLVAHHTPDLYGSDRQLLESVGALRAAGHEVVATVPADGPLCALLRARGATVELLAVPVLRKTLMTPRGLIGLAWGALRAVGPAVRLVRRSGADVVYVNTVIVPLWIVAARLARTPVLVHVHEVFAGPRVQRTLLALPLLLATRVMLNSRASLASLRAAAPRAARAAVVVPNGMPGPPHEPAPTRGRTRDAGPAVLALVARLSPNKGVDVALEAVAGLLARGYDVRLVVAGSAFPGYEWYAEQLARRAARADLAGRVDLVGYVHPTWDLLASADVVLVPSRVEPFGNAAVEAQLARRPVVASRVQGLPEVVTGGETGLLVAPDDPVALTEAVAALLDDPERAARLADRARDDASRRFSPRRYARDVVHEVSWTLGGATTTGNQRHQHH